MLGSHFILANFFGGVFAASSLLGNPVVLQPSSPLLHKHGRWDHSSGTWWAGSGFKLVVSNANSLTLHLGNHTTAPQVAVALSIDYGDFKTINVTTGANNLPIAPIGTLAKEKYRVVRINTEGWQNNRIHLQKIELNEGAIVKLYSPSALRFQFIGDSLSSGVSNPRGINDAWTFLVAQNFKAEHNVNAQPGACLTDQLCWGNAHGISYQYLRTEDTGYFDTTDHNYTTPWDFRNDLSPTHIVLAIGANDYAYNITSSAFGNTLSAFVDKLRNLYHQQPIFVFSPWGWPQSDWTSPFSTYYDGIYNEVVNKRTAAGDKNLYLVNATGWVGYDGVFVDNLHPNPIGNRQIAGNFTSWLNRWGLQPQTHWGS